MRCKVIFFNKERYCIYAEDVVRNPEEEKDELYILFLSPALSVNIDRVSRELFLDDRYKAFSLINRKGYYILSPVGEDEMLSYKHGKSETKIFGEKLLGKGAFGAVRQITIQPVVYKTFNKGVMPQDVVKEVAVYSLLGQHTCIPRYYGYEKDEKKSHLFIEKGEVDLYKAIKIPEHQPKRLLFFFKILKCMRAISTQGIIHGDIKPENFIVKDDTVQIIDFGLCGIEYNNQSPRVKAFSGTPIYLAPELIPYMSTTECRYTYKTDIYSLGIVLLDLLGIDLEDNIIYNGDDTSFILEKVFGIQIYGPSAKQVLQDKIHGGSEQILEIKQWLMDRYKKLGASTVDLASKMLCFNPKYRIDYDEAIIHPLFQKMKRETIPKLPVFINNMPEVFDLENVYTSGEFSERLVLFDNFLKICEKYEFCPETLALACQLTDVYKLNTNSFFNDISVAGLSLSAYLFERGDRVVEMIDEHNISANDQMEVMHTLGGNILIPSLVAYMKHNNKIISLEQVLEFYKRGDIYRISFKDFVKKM